MNKGKFGRKTGRKMTPITFIDGITMRRRLRMDILLSGDSGKNPRKVTMSQVKNGARSIIFNMTIGRGKAPSIQIMLRILPIL